MNKTKGYKNRIRKLYRNGEIKPIPVYELDYDHCFIKLSPDTVYDYNDGCVYAFQTGCMP